MTSNKVIGNRLQPQSRTGKISSVHFQNRSEGAGKAVALLLNRRADKTIMGFFLLGFLLVKG